MSGFICTMVGASFAVAAVAEVLRSKKGITAVGNAQVSTAQSQFGGSSYLGDGTGDYLIANNVSTFLGDFTIECWFRTSSVSSDQYIITADGVGTALPGVAAYLNGNALKIYSNQNGSWTHLGNVTVATISINTWYHISITRSGSTWYASVNGTITNLGTYGATISASGDVIVGALTWTSVVSYVGHIDEVRVSNSARYTTTFTPSTTPFVNDANTLLLIHANGTNASTFFEDDNGAMPVSTRTANSITVAGNAQVSTAQSQFGGASLLLDGTGDYLTVNNSAGILSFNTTQDFTFEAWCRFANTNTYFTIFSGPGQTGSFTLARVDDNTVRVGRTNVAWDATSTGSATTANTWQHIAASRSNGTLRIFVNGVSVHSSANTQSYPLTTTMGIGGDTVFGSSSNGYIDEVRVSNIARYTANFTPSTTPFVNDPTTLFLMHADGANASTTFTDDTLSYRTQKGIQAFGNAQVDTAQSKFGGSSALFDGTDDWLEAISGNNDWKFLTGNNFTFEGWFRSTNNSGVMLSGYDSTTFRFSFYFDSGQVSFFSPGTSGIFTGDFPTANTWNHWAITRNSGVTKFWYNGTETLSTSSSWNADITKFVLGGENPSGSTISGDYSGYIDEFRVSNIARYTTTFTPSTTPFVNDANTVLLMHMNQADAATIFQDDNTGTVTTEDSYTVPTAAFASDALTVALWHFDNNGTDSGPNGYTLNTTGGYSSSVVKFGTHSGDLADSTSDFFAHTTDRQFAPYNGSIMTDLTWECWVYYTSFSGASFNHASQNNPHPTLLCAGDQGGNRQSLKFGFSGSEGPYASGLLCFAAGDLLNGNIDTHTARGTVSYSLNTWYHIALTYNSLTGNVKGYVNGVKEFTKQAPNLGYSLPTHFTIGAMQSNNSACYVDEVRVSRMIRYGI